MLKMKMLKIIHTVIGLLMATIIIVGSAFIGELFTNMTLVQFAEKIISFDLNIWGDMEFQRFCFFFIIGMIVLGVGLFPIKKSINEFFELHFYQFN